MYREVKEYSVVLFERSRSYYLTQKIERTLKCIISGRAFYLTFISFCKKEKNIKKRKNRAQQDVLKYIVVEQNESPTIENNTIRWFFW